MHINVHFACEGLNGWGIYGSNRWDSYGKVSYIFGGDMLKKHLSQGSTLSGHCMTMGFSPFELPTRGVLQKGQDHSPPKVCFEEPCFEEPSFWLAHSAINIHSAMNI